MAKRPFARTAAVAARQPATVPDAATTRPGRRGAMLARRPHDPPAPPVRAPACRHHGGSRTPHPAPSVPPHAESAADPPRHEPQPCQPSTQPKPLLSLRLVVSGLPGSHPPPQTVEPAGLRLGGLDPPRGAGGLVLRYLGGDSRRILGNLGPDGNVETIEMSPLH